MIKKRIGPRPLVAHHSLLQQAIGDGSILENDLKKFLQSVDLYQKNKSTYADITADIFDCEEESALYIFEAHEKQKKDQVLFIIPSLINRATILDLTHERSMCRYFARQGFDVYLLEWGEPQERNSGFNLHAYYQKRLKPLFEKVYEKHQEPIHVMGFCMGGVFTLGVGQDREIIEGDQVASVAFFAPPWDFSTVNEKDSKNLVSYYKTIKNITKFLEVDQIQMMFLGLDPWHVYNKFLKFASYDPASEKATYFIAMEDWVNDGVPLVRDVADEIILGWYQDNLLPKKQVSWGEEMLDPALVKVPHAVFIADKDRIVPMGSSQSLADQLPEPDVFHYLCGHTSLVAGDVAIKNVWQDYKNWLLSL